MPNRRTGESVWPGHRHGNATSLVGAACPVTAIWRLRTAFRALGREDDFGPIDRLVPDPTDDALRGCGGDTECCDDLLYQQLRADAVRLPNGVEPQSQRNSAVLERRADRRVEMIAAPLAGIGTFRLDPVPVRRAATSRTIEAGTEAGLE